MPLKHTLMPLIQIWKPMVYAEMPLKQTLMPLIQTWKPMV
jgi:hypothetical protein